MNYETGCVGVVVETAEILFEEVVGSTDSLGFQMSGTDAQGLNKDFHQFPGLLLLSDSDAVDGRHRLRN